VLSATKSVKAQATWGVKAGANHSQIHFFDETGFTQFGLFYIERIGFHAGLQYQKPLTTCLGVQVEMLYNQKGARFLPEYPFGFRTEQRALNFLSIPVLADFSLWKGFSLQGGGEIGLLLNKGEAPYNNEAYEAGLAIGVAKTFLHRFQLTGRYIHGVQPVGTTVLEGENLAGEPNPIRILARTRTFQFSVAYSFGKKPVVNQ
jgi:hypothetical protein